MTNPRFKDFGAGTGGDAVKAPLTFKLHGEEFSCVTQVQGKIMLDMVKDASSDDPSKSAAMIDMFFKHVLLEESFTRFDALCKHPDKIVTVETLAEITAWLVEEYSGRPEEQPTVS
jgi:hypothetical protein